MWQRSNCQFICGFIQNQWVPLKQSGCLSYYCSRPAGPIVGVTTQNWGSNEEVGRLQGSFLQYFFTELCEHALSTTGSQPSGHLSLLLLCCSPGHSRNS